MRSQAADGPGEVVLDPVRRVPRSRWEITAASPATSPISARPRGFGEDHHAERVDSGYNFQIRNPRTEKTITRSVMTTNRGHHAEVLS